MHKEGRHCQALCLGEHFGRVPEALAFARRYSRLGQKVFYDAGSHIVATSKMSAASSPGVVHALKLQIDLVRVLVISHDLHDQCTIHEIK